MEVSSKSSAKFPSLGVKIRSPVKRSDPDLALDTLSLSFLSTFPKMVCEKKLEGKLVTAYPAVDSRKAESITRRNLTKRERKRRRERE